MTIASLGDRVARAAATLGSKAEPRLLDRVTTWCTRVKETNARIDLTAARDDDELVDLLVADAIVLAARLPAGARVVDVGSGAGAPGLPIALLREDLEVTLVEPLDKRVSFLRSVIGGLGPAPGARVPRVVRGRGEVLAPQGGGPAPFDVATSRATLPPAEWLALGERLAAADVWVLVARATAEVDAIEARAAESVDYVWPLTGVRRRALRVRSASPR